MDDSIEIERGRCVGEGQKEKVGREKSEKGSKENGWIETVQIPSLLLDDTDQSSFFRWNSSVPSVVPSARSMSLPVSSVRSLIRPPLLSPFRKLMLNR